MGGWLAILSLALVAFALAAFMLRLPKEGYALFGSVLLFGLAGYAWQGSPDQPGSPKAAMIQEPRSGEDMVQARSALFDDTQQKPNYLLTSDAFARKGQFDDAAGLLRKGLEDNPNHIEGWLALAMALTAHAEGFVTPAAVHAYDRARAIDPANPAADFFLGFSFLQSGEIRQARNIWAGLLARSPEDAPWREDLEARVTQLDDMIANAPMLQ
ncbi:tetratricopeptide repeat protein [Erythrobacter crassostreae]|uniref:Tetratricopeptide repeat protein n=1 Tax=Erythrobacter crassostreae TaxID=2828328 RepID=A0A9X1F3M9_9SPHN|nr:tetratricopeptide repeat protein [Erythrobacter crassostrea]MBV7259680.1 tetratricopeptide repeat protein [Erythrobacter crassostrea]